MTAAADVLKNFNLFVDGRGYAGRVDEVNPPKLAIKTEDYRGGGMDTSIAMDMGMEKLESDFTLVSYSREVLALFGVAPGNVVPFVVRGALESHDGTVTKVVHTMRGKIREIDSGTIKAGDKPALKVQLDLDYYKLEHGQTVVHEIDVVNMTRIVNGTDRLADIRNAIGV